MTLLDLAQAWIAVCGAISVYLLGSKHHDKRKWGYVVGLASEPAWLYAAWPDQWGIIIMVAVFTAGWIRGVRNNFFSNNETNFRVSGQTDMKRVEVLLDLVSQQIRTLNHRRKQLMHTAQELDTLITSETATVAAIAALVTDLRTQIKNIPGVPVDVAAAIDDAFVKAEGQKAALVAALTPPVVAPPVVEPPVVVAPPVA